MLAILTAGLPLWVAAGIEIRTPEKERPVDLGRLLGGNVALWYQKRDLEAADVRNAVERWKPSLLRLPGGSWSDEVYWNGNGVRKGEDFDASKRQGPQWQIDYSEYAPGLRLGSADGSLSDFHGHLDVRALHEYVRDRGAAAIVTVNAGTGTPEMAAEWVKWAKKEGYRVDYWEVGNELDGEWELGHVGPDGKVVDADEYARRFAAFAKAMKAVDPGIKVGGPTASNDQLPFVETLIRESGELLDFVTFHTYPVLGGGKSEGERFAKADDVAKAVERIREWIAKYQPGREDEIEIGVTEWHKQVMETRPTVDLSSGLWTCLFIGAMAESGVDFANQWDYFSDVGAGGHGLFGVNGEGARAVFHAMMLWREHMGSELLEISGLPEGVAGFATLRDGKPRVMLINKTRRPVRIDGVALDGAELTGSVKAWRFSQREYFWNPLKQRPEWSHAAREIAVDASGFEVPGFCALVVSDESEELEGEFAGKPSLEILVPAEAPADLPVEGFVLVRGDDGAWGGTLSEVSLDLEGVGGASLKKVDTASSVGVFEVTPEGPGESRIKATADGLQAEATIRWTEVKQRDQVVWEFAGDASMSGLETSYQLAADSQARPNQTVAMMTLEAAEDVAEKNTLLAIKSLPEGLERERIGGVIGLLGGSPDLHSDDPNAFVQIVLQSNLDHWMPVGRVPLRKLAGSWEKLSIVLDDPRLLEAMGELYGIRFHLKSNQPVEGRIYLDDLGFILRGE
ncbi:alpha-N-arabinofuranosidase [Haloferula helveola]|uniref:Alpha-N-arabinofuranosidase n=2 Tax=Haloferula helveola TaxID=490095 RepID=A0ABM7RJ18_9BACT|nr:alpha-N-arabinofuranosidase [Haloferula helveola]